MTNDQRRNDVMDLHEIANTPGFGSGKNARDKLADDAQCRAELPAAASVAQVMARNDDGRHLVPLAHFGNSTEDGKDWGLYHDGTDNMTAAFGHDAKRDAVAVAAIINAYRLGILVVKT